MAVSDLDSCDLHVSFYDPFTGKPFVDSVSGLTSLDMKYTACQFNDLMFEPKQTASSTASITFEPFTVKPELRGILNNLKEGTRVELYGHQPDCGVPVFAGFVMPGGITETAGAVTIQVGDTIEQGSWQTLRRIETLNDSASGLYTRALSHWVDVLSEDFSNPAGVQASYTVTNMTVAPKSVSITSGLATGYVTGAIVDPGYISFAVGDTWLVEVDFALTFDTATTASSSLTESSTTLTMGLQGTIARAIAWDRILLQVTADVTAPPLSSQLTIGQGVNYTAGSVNLLAGGGNVVYVPADYPLVPNPRAGRLQMLLRVTSPTTILMSAFINQQQIISSSPLTVNAADVLWTGVSLQPRLDFLALDASSAVTRWRVRRLAPYINRAARFNPQTADAMYYQPNSETCLSFLQIVLEKDGAEYRCKYRHWPQLDEIELDQVGTLGSDVSATLGYGQPAGLSKTGSPQTSPFTATTDDGSYLVTPPFRFEEGWNLSDLPAVNTKAQSYANEVIRMGSNTADAQIFADTWSPADTGNPVQGIAPIRPCMEVVTSDDRVGLQPIAASMAAAELKRRQDTTPSLTLKVLGSLEHAWKWRAGDRVFVKTLSLLNNVETSMRIVSVQHIAGSAERVVTLGYVEQDPTSLSILHSETVQSWSYEQSGSSGLVYVYPYVGSIGTGVTSTAFTIVLDQFTAQTAITSATLHWVTDGVNGVDVLAVQPVLDGATNALPGITRHSATDSGTVDVTAYAGLGKHTIAFYNSSGSATGLVSAFLTLRLKI